MKKRKLIYVIISILGIIIRIYFKDFQSDDWTRCWIPWLKAIEGPFSNIANYPGDYNLPYVTILWFINHSPIPNLYGVKLLSVLFDYILAIGAAKLVSYCTVTENSERAGLIAYGLVVLSPVVILNSSWWAQCDSIYSACLIWSLYCFVRNKNLIGMILFGCALAAKLQAIIAVPLLLIYWWKNKKFSALLFMVVPLSIEILCIPAMLAGWPLFVTYSQYLGQTSEYQYLFHLYPNIWALLHGASYWICVDLAIVGLIGVLAIITLVISAHGRDFNRETLLLYSTFICMTCLFFLPQMHERYGFFLEILFICLAVTNQKHIVPAIAINCLTILFYNSRPIMFEKIITYPTGIIYFSCYLWVAFCSYKELNAKEIIKC